MSGIGWHGPQVKLLLTWQLDWKKVQRREQLSCPIWRLACFAQQPHKRPRGAWPPALQAPAGQGRAVAGALAPAL